MAGTAFIQAPERRVPEAATRSAEAATAATAAPPATPMSKAARLRPIGPRPADDRRSTLARAVIRTLQSAIGDRPALDIVLAGTAEHERPSVARARLVVRTPDAVSRILLPPSGDAFAEAYLRGDLDIEGEVMSAISGAESIDPRRLSAAELRRVVRWTLELRAGTPRATPLTRVSAMAGRQHSRARDMAAIRFHYDVGESFYGLWLDRRMAYSCAYFPNGSTAATAAGTLDAAQEAKLELVARKLLLAPGMRLLDIGSGWGSLIDLAAERFGVDALGVTLSQRQADESNARAARGGLAGRSTARVMDYRDMGTLGRFDAVASVGMFEHVGRPNLPTYFRAAWDALVPGGLFLNHGIAAAGPGRRRTDLRPRGNRFLQDYVFPDGELVPIEDAIGIARAAGFEVIDVQSLRPHYALTLAAWVARLEANWDAAVAAAGDEVARTWRLYMAAARLGFERGDLDVCQLLLARPVAGRPAARPLRPWW